MFDYNKLKSFVTVVDLGSVSKAAKHLNRTQSAISQQLDILEDELGVSLCESLRSGILLTKEGRDIYEHVAKYFNEIDGCLQENQQNLEELTGKIRVGCSPSIAHHFLSNMVGKFLVKYPKIGLELILHPDQQVEKLLREDELDFGFIIDFENRQYFRCQTQYEFEEYLVCSKQYLEQMKKERKNSLDKYICLHDADFIDFGFDLPNIRFWLKKNCSNYRSILRHRDASIVVEDYGCIKKLVLENAGVATMPSYMIQSEIQSGEMVQLFPQSLPMIAKLDLAFRKKKNFTPSLRTFLSFAKEYSQ